MSKRKGLLFVVAFSLFWAIQIVLIRFGLLQGIEPISFLFQITLLAFIFLSIYNLTTKKEFIKAKGSMGKIILIAISGSVLGNLLAYFGLKFSTAINYGFIIKISLVFTVLLAYFFLKEPLNKKKIMLMIILLIGVYLVTTKGILLIPKIGDILIILAAFFYSTQAVISKSVLKKVPAEILANMRTFFASLFLFPIAYFINKNLFVIQHIGLVIVIAITMFFALIFLYKTLEIKSASYFTMMNMITPIIVVVLSLIFLRELINLNQIIGGTLIIISGILIYRADI